MRRSLNGAVYANKAFLLQKSNRQPKKFGKRIVRLFLKNGRIRDRSPPHRIMRKRTPEKVSVFRS